MNYDWLKQDSLLAAPALLGWELVSHAGGVTTGGIIVEVEAYHEKDAASHSYHGVTKRTAPMFQKGGTVYVYLSYGMHSCMNITTGPAGEGQAVLIRALEPTLGIATMTTRRRTDKPRQLTSGPGKLTQALGITLDLSGTYLGGVLELRRPQHPLATHDIVAGPRIGISKAKDLPWRFYLKGSQFISVLR